MDGEPLFELGVDGERVTDEMLLEQDSPSDLNVAPGKPFVLIKVPKLSPTVEDEDGSCLAHRPSPIIKCDPSKSISCSFW